MNTETLGDIDPRAIGYIMGAGGSNIQAIQTKAGKECRINYNNQHKRFEIKARTQKSCTSIKEDLYKAEAAWKTQRRQYFYDKEQQQNEKQTLAAHGHAEHVRQIAIGLKQVGGIQDKKHQRWKAKQLKAGTASVCEVSEMAEMSETPEYCASDHAFPSMGGSAKSVSTGKWAASLDNVKSAASIVVPVSMSDAVDQETSTTRQKTPVTRKKPFVFVDEPKNKRCFHLLRQEIDSNSDTGMYA